MKRQLLKNSIIFKIATFLLVLAVAVVGCNKHGAYPVEKENENNMDFCSCPNVENPLTDLFWLKEIVDVFEYDASVFGYNPHARIYKCMYTGGIGFFLEMYVGCPYAEYSFWNCEGTVLCSGEFTEEDICPDFNIDFENKKLIWGRTANPLLEKYNLKPALRIVYSENFKSETANDASEIALYYLQQKKDVLELCNNLGDFKISKTQKSSAGEYVYFQQYVNDIPVYATNFIVYVNNDNIVTYALNEFRNIAKYKEIESDPSVTNNEALKIAYTCLNVTRLTSDEPPYDPLFAPMMELFYFESIDKGLELAWNINFSSMEPSGSWQVFVSTELGHVIHVQNNRIIN